MPRYSNGRVPSGALVKLDTGNGRHWSTPTSGARWYLLRDNVYRKYGKTLQISPGMNGYRDWDEQGVGRRNACASGNCNGAAAQGYSSHGGTWRSAKYTGGAWVDAMAFDIGNYSIIGQAAFYAEARAVGFLVGAITPELAGIFEPWHIIDLDPWGAIPAGGGGKDFDMPLTNEDVVKILTGEFPTGRRKADGSQEFKSVASALSASYFYGDLLVELIRALPNEVWAHKLKHAISGKDVPAGDLLRYEPAEHEATRTAQGTGGVDVDALAERLRASLGADVVNELAKRLTS